MVRADLHDYVTDGERLYRVEYFLPDDTGVCLENARDNSTVIWTMPEFRERILRRVDPEKEGLVASANG